MTVLTFALYFVVRRMCFDGFGFTITDWSTILYDNLIKSRKKVVRQGKNANTVA